MYTATDTLPSNAVLHPGTSLVLVSCVALAILGLRLCVWCAAEDTPTESVDEDAPVDDEDGAGTVNAADTATEPAAEADTDAAADGTADVDTPNAGTWTADRVATTVSESSTQSPGPEARVRTPDTPHSAPQDGAADAQLPLPVTGNPYSLLYTTDEQSEDAWSCYTSDTSCWFINRQLMAGVAEEGHSLVPPRDLHTPAPTPEPDDSDLQSLYDRLEQELDDLEDALDAAVTAHGSWYQELNDLFEWLQRNRRHWRPRQHGTCDMHPRAAQQLARVFLNDFERSLSSDTAACWGMPIAAFVVQRWPDIAMEALCSASDVPSAGGSPTADADAGTTTQTNAAMVCRALYRALRDCGTYTAYLPRLEVLLLAFAKHLPARELFERGIVYAAFCGAEKSSQPVAAMRAVQPLLFKCHNVGCVHPDPLYTAAASRRAFIA